ncbi:MAG: hypothetical protein Kow0099_15370 [Candidatus Abyssubacteria bacterium]
MQSEKYERLFLISCFIVAIALFHYGTPGRLMYLHILLQALFFIPVSLAGLWFGRRGGLLAAGAVSALYIYHAVTVMMPTWEMAISNGIQIAFLFIVGFLVGIYVDIREGYRQTMSGPGPRAPVTFPTEQRLLVYLDETEASMNAVRYVARLFGRVLEAQVTLMAVFSKLNPELFRSHKEHQEERPRALESSKRAIERAYAILKEGGFDDSRIATRFANSQNARISDVILNEQRSGDYTAIVVGKHHLSRAEEFLFGNVAVRLAREASCPVWLIDETGLQQTKQAEDFSTGPKSQPE